MQGVHKQRAGFIWNDMVPPFLKEQSLHSSGGTEEIHAKIFGIADNVAVIETGYVCRAEAWNVKTVHICTVENN